MAGAEAARGARSGFVTAMAWLSLAAAFATLLLCFAGWRVLGAGPELLAGALAGTGLEVDPAALVSLRQSLPWTAATALVLLWVSAALLKRREWARIAFIVILLASAAWTLIATIRSPGLAAASPLPELQPLFAAAHWLTVGLSVVLVGVHLWIAWRFRAPEVRREFGRD